MSGDPVGRRAGVQRLVILLPRTESDHSFDPVYDPRVSTSWAAVLPALYLMSAMSSPGVAYLAHARYSSVVGSPTVAGGTSACRTRIGAHLPEVCTTSDGHKPGFRRSKAHYHDRIGGELQTPPGRRDKQGTAMTKAGALLGPQRSGGLR